MVWIANHNENEINYFTNTKIRRESITIQNLYTQFENNWAYASNENTVSAASKISKESSSLRHEFLGSFEWLPTIPFPFRSQVLSRRNWFVVNDGVNPLSARLAKQKMFLTL